MSFYLVSAVTEASASPAAALGYDVGELDSGGFSNGRMLRQGRGDSTA
jgi:hypothetical protein